MFENVLLAKLELPQKRAIILRSVKNRTEKRLNARKNEGREKKNH